LATTAIINAIVYDGEGTPGCHDGNLIFDDQTGLIMGVNVPTVRADRIIDADQMAVAPGFIDAHGHSDISLLAAPEALGKISQGITTEIAGNCGLSPFPVTDRNREHLQGMYEQYQVTIGWNDLAGYAAELASRRPAINLAVHCGHNTLRSAVVGYDERPLERGQLPEMRQYLRQALEQGAAGFSTGLIYVPGKFAEPAEIVALLKELGPFGRPYATHLRSEGARLLEAVDEAVGSSLAAGIPRLHFSHLKTARPENWHKLDEVFKRIDKAEKSGLAVTVDRYPYIESMTQLSVAMPSPWDNLPDRTITERLAAPEARRELSDSLRDFTGENWHRIRLAATNHPVYRAYCGLLLPEIAEQTGKSCAELCVALLQHNSAATLAAFSGMSMDNLKLILHWDRTACGTDETARPLDEQFGRSHPRGFGSFPQFFRLLAGMDTPTEEIIRRFTSLPADIFRLPRRGRLLAGNYADIVVFSPERYTSQADFRKPHQLAEGIYLVVVNGKITYQYGEGVKQRNGRFLAAQ